MGLEPALAAVLDMVCLNSEDRLQAADELVLRASVGGCYENGVIAGNRSGYFGPLGFVDRDGDALGRPDGGADHGNGRTGALEPSHELRQRAEIPVRASELVRGQHVRS